MDDKRTLITDQLHNKFKTDIAISWLGAYGGNIIISINILAWDWTLQVELDNMLFNENDVDANVDFIMYYVRRGILDIFLKS